MVNNKGFSLIEVLVGIAVLGISVVTILSMRAGDSKGVSQLIAQDAKSYVFKELLINLENKASCGIILKNKIEGDNLSFISSDGINITSGALINKTHKIIEFKYKFIPVVNIPSGYQLVDIYFVLSPLYQPAKKVTQELRVLAQASGLVNNCISPREDGGALVQQKAIQLAKTKVCTEDLNGSLDASGKCQWNKPVTYDYITIQL